MADKDKLRFLTGQEANLKDKTLVRGQVYFAISSDTDSGKIYFDAPIDNNTTKRILMSSDHAKTADKATAADRATADSNGRKFTETYVSEIKLDDAGTTILYKYPDITTWKELKPKFLPLTGGTITGELYADSITAGDLLVNGSARFVNTILGNIETANQWKTARGFQIADSDAAHTSVSVNVNGSGNVVLKLPSTIKAALQGNADTATKATNDSNNKKITDEYLHRVSNTSSILNQFSGAPKYLLGIESFTDGGEVKWQSVDGVKVGSASGADKWNTARNFQVSDSDAAHTGTAVSVNGSKAIVLPLPATIKATLEGNASSANKVNHKYTLTLGKTKQTAFDGSADVSITITPESIGALSKDEASAGAAKWSTARMFYVADADASNTGEGVSVDGSKDITLKLPSTIKAAITGHASEDLSLAGGTMTGNISYKGSKATNSMIRFLNNTTDTSGNGISIGGGGVTVIGAGESSQNLTPAANEEALYLTSDGNIKFYTYCDTIGNKRGVILDTSRNFYPDVNNSGSIGTSSNKWASMYATTFYGALSGTASHATSDIRGNAIINTYLTNVYAKSDDSSYLYKQVGPSSERSAELIGRYTPLDSDGLINMKYIPAAALERVVVVANQTAQYALTTANVQLGDVVKRNDTGQLYFVVDTNNLGNAGGYLQFTAGTAANVNWSGILNRPNIVGSATGNAIVPNAANTEFTVYQVNGNGTSTSYVIKPNFLSKTGGTITGELYVDGGTTLASLLVNGDARFVNTIQGSISGNAGSATKWATAKAFYIADAEAKHTSSPQVNIDGSQSSYTLKLPSTIKATLEGNADTATKLTNLTEADKASSTNTWRRVWFAYDDNVNGRPAYSDTFAYQSSTGTVKATKFQGALVGNADSASKWKTARSFITNLGSESAASVDGSTGPYNLGVTGTLPVSHGGTGNTTFTASRAIYAETATKLSSSGHYMSSSKLAINSTSEPGYQFYVNGSTYLNGKVYINTATDTAPFYITRGGSEAEAVAMSVNDSTYTIAYTNNEASNQIRIRMINTDTEDGTKDNTTDWSFYFNSKGQFLPNADGSGSIGISTQRWKSIYASNFYGLADKATSDGSGHNIEDTYLKRSGGTMIGTINSQIVQPKTNNTYTLGSSSNRWSTLYSVNIDNTGSWTWYGNQNFILKATANNQEWSFDQCADSTSYTGTYSHFWSSKNSVSIIRFYTDDNQVQIPSTGFMGIGGAGDASYKLKVTGNTYLTGTLYVGGSSTFNNNLTVNSGGKVKVQNTTDSKNSQDSNASLSVQGGVSVAKQLSAKTIRIDGSGSDTIGSTTQGCTVHFNKTNNCIEFVFD